MPVAMLITGPGDARDAVGLFLAGRGWTVVPIAPEPERVVELFAAAGPEIVVADYRDEPERVGVCVAALGEGASILALNVPDDTVLPDAIVSARGANDIPRAPGSHDPHSAR